MGLRKEVLVVADTAARGGLRVQPWLLYLEEKMVPTRCRLINTWLGLVLGGGGNVGCCRQRGVGFDGPGLAGYCMSQEDRTCLRDSWPESEDS